MTPKLAVVFLTLASPSFAGEKAFSGGGPLGQGGDSVSTTLKFGRGAAPSDLPGYLLGTANAVYQFESDFDSLPGEVSALDYSLWSPLSHFQAGDFHIVPFLGLRTTQFDTSLDNLLTESTLTSIRLPIVMFHDLSDKWIYGGMIMPGFSGDLSNGDNFSIAGAVGVGRQFSSQLMAGAGVYYSRGFEDDLFLPGVAFKWRPSRKWEIFLLGPIGGANYSINDDWMVSLIGQYDALTWNIEADSEGPARDITTSSFRVGVKLERRFSDHFWIQMTGGLSMAKEITIEDLDNRTLQEDEIDSGPFLQFGGNFRF